MKNLTLLALLVCCLQTYAQELTIQDSTQVANEVSFAIIENVPVYKGCNKSLTNEKQKACFNEKINAHISKKFNSAVSETIDAPNGTLAKVTVMFKIDTTGNIVDIYAKSDYPELEAEAIRVINLIPQLEPGYVRGKAVRVPYFLPIKFKINKKKNTPTSMQFPTFRGCNNTVSFEDLKQCTTQKIMDYVKVSVNYELADTLFPTDKSTQFQVSFIINEKGKTEDISAKAHHRDMAAEAIRILKRMPKMKEPGYINGKAAKFPVEFLMTIYF